MRPSGIIGGAIVAAMLSVSLPASAVVLTGAVHSQGAQNILAPRSMVSPVTLQFFVPEGTHVKKGQPVLRIDASTASAQLQTLQDKIALTTATNAKELAALQLAAIDAQLALVQAKSERDKAKLDAGVPSDLISALQYDTYQGAYESARRDVALKEKTLAAAQAAVKRQRKDGALQLRKLKLQLEFYQTEVNEATVVATQNGVVVHGFQHLWFSGNDTPGRYREGSIAFPGSQVGQVVGANGQQFSVIAWALQPDRRGLKAGQTVSIHFDALPGVEVSGHIQAISTAAESRSEWGDGHYYRVDVKLDAAAEKLTLLPGMSARVQTQVEIDHKPRNTTTAAQRTLHVTGQVFAQRSWDAIPPRIRGLWRLNITRMAPDGGSVKKGQAIVTFAAGRMAQEYPATQSKLKEQERIRKRLRLKLANDKRTAELAVAKAKSDAKKAKRKATQPKGTIAAIEYQKLLIDRESTQVVLALTQKRSKIAAASRKAQLAEADAEVIQTQSEVARMQKSMASLTLRAPRAGLFLHRIKNDGSRVDTGDRVFFGRPVGSMPDMGSLAVHAALPERDLRLVHIGQPVQVVLTGGASRTLDGHIASIGQNIHSKSNAQPIPVVRLLVTFDNKTPQLKPGRSVSVVIQATQEDAS